MPVASDGELYVVSERENEIRVNALEAATGNPRWSQLLAYSDTDIAADVPRLDLAHQSLGRRAASKSRPSGTSLIIS